MLLTGASRGIGHATVKRFSAAGWRVITCSRHAFPENCPWEAGPEDHIQVDLADPAGTLEAIAEMRQRLVEGQLHALVNNAGISPFFESLDTLSEELFDKVVGLNLKGPFRLAAVIGTRMAAGDGGSIINVSSTGAVRPRADIVPYAAAKAGLNAVTVGLAHAFGPSVRVNAIMCGTFLTDVSAAWDMEAFARRAATFALGRGGQPHEVVGTALYLASDWSSFTTGAVITVDGGQP